MKQTERVTQALALVAQGKTPYRAAKMMGISLSTIYKAIKRNRCVLIDAHKTNP